jgi:hypothetical protein
VIYYVSGLTGATAATDAHVICALWNPHADRVIEIRRLSINAITAPGAGAGFNIRRMTTRGTPGSTVTPGAPQHHRGVSAPASGFLLDLATYSAQPTLVAGDIGDGWSLAAAAASGLILPYPDGLEVRPGQGVALVNRAAIIVPACEVSFTVVER